MRSNLARDPKVIAMARFLSEDDSFCDAFFASRHKSVTLRVTLRVVTSVTVASLLEVWGALNESVNSSGEMPMMAIDDVDIIADVPGLGRAMLHVGWLEQMEGGGLMFPNFAEHNSPQKGRKKASSDAERARRYRERKKEKKETVTNVTAVTGEKRREEKSIRIETNVSCPVEPDGEQDLPSFDSSQESHQIESAPPQKPARAKPSKPAGLDSTPILRQLWEATPPMGRQRSGKLKVFSEWSKIRTAERPDAETLLAALNAWKDSEKWTRDDGEFVEGLHIWVKNRQWENLPAPMPKTQPNGAMMPPRRKGVLS